MRAVENDEEWALTSPKDDAVIRRISARSLWIRILTARVETGEPYLLFIDHVNKAIPEHHKLAGLTVKMSNLCSEITLPTGTDPMGNERTAVCCLSSLNLETYLEWQDEPQFVEDCLRFLDNVIDDFVAKAPRFDGTRAKYSALRERSVGLGVMGLHSFLQTMSVPLESVMAQVWNRRMFKQIKEQCDAASVKLALERGPCPDAADYGIMERFSNKIAIAPTASISIICGGTSAGIEPIPTNSYTHKTLSGSFGVRNQQLETLLTEKGCNNEETWSSIIQNEGSVQQLDCLTEHEKTGVQDRLRAGPALADRARRRPHALCLPVAIAQPLHPGRYPQARPAPDPLPGLEEGREIALLLPLEIGGAGRGQSGRGGRQ